MAASWRDVLPVHPAAELFPQLSRDELIELGEDIKTHGGLPAIPVTLWRAEEDPRAFLLDGRNRLDAMEAVGLPVLDKHGEWLTRIERRYVRGDPYVYVISANIHRRHLTAEQKRDLITRLLKERPEASNLAIAKVAKVDDKTVAAVRREKEARSEIPNVATRTDTKGRKQPASKTRGSKTKRKPSRRELEAKEAHINELEAAREHDNDLANDLAEQLQAAKIKIAGLESEVEEAKAAAEPPPESKSASRCSICREKKRAVLRRVFVCDSCADIHELETADARKGLHPVAE
jgi:hypothetical protein